MVRTDDVERLDRTLEEVGGLSRSHSHLLTRGVGSDKLELGKENAPTCANTRGADSLNLKGRLP